jgi:hypothetical protein
MFNLVSSSEDGKEILKSSKDHIISPSPFCGMVLEPKTSCMLSKLFTTWATHSILLFVFCFWDRAPLTLPNLDLNSRFSRFCLPSSWDYMHVPPCPAFLTIYRILNTHKSYLKESYTSFLGSNAHALILATWKAEIGKIMVLGQT